MYRSTDPEYVVRLRRFGITLADLVCGRDEDVSFFWVLGGESHARPRYSLVEGRKFGAHGRQIRSLGEEGRAALRFGFQQSFHEAEIEHDVETVEVASASQLKDFV